MIGWLKRLRAPKTRAIVIIDERRFDQTNWEPRRVEVVLLEESGGLVKVRWPDGPIGQHGLPEWINASQIEVRLP